MFPVSVRRVAPRLTKAPAPIRAVVVLTAMVLLGSGLIGSVLATSSLGVNVSGRAIGNVYPSNGGEGSSWCAGYWYNWSHSVAYDVQIGSPIAYHKLYVNYLDYYGGALSPNPPSPQYTMAWYSVQVYSASHSYTAPGLYEGTHTFTGNDMTIWVQDVFPYSAAGSPVVADATWAGEGPSGNDWHFTGCAGQSETIFYPQY